MTSEVLAAPLGEVELYISEQEASDTSSELMALRTVQQLSQDVLPKFRSRGTVEPSSLAASRDALTTLRRHAKLLLRISQELREQAANSAEALTNKEAELREFEARVELSKVLPEVTRRVAALKRANTLTYAGVEDPPGSAPSYRTVQDS